MQVTMLWAGSKTLAEATQGAMGLHLWACAYEFADKKPEVVEGSIVDELRRMYLQKKAEIRERYPDEVSEQAYVEDDDLL